MIRIFIYFSLVLLNQVFGNILSGLVESVPTEPPSPKIGFFQKLALPVCPGFENELQHFENDLLRTSIFGAKPPPEQALSCKKLFLGDFIQAEQTSRICDYSYVVAIKTRKNEASNFTTVCQGLLLPDCTIATLYECVQLGTDLKVEFPNGDVVNVVCIQESQKFEHNLIGTVFVVRLRIDASCCNNLVTTFPNFAVTSPKDFVSGFLVSRDCSSCRLSLNPVESALISLNLSSVEIKLALPSDVDLICQPYYGGTPFIDKYCNVQGIAFRRPVLAMSTLFEVPAANQIETSCFITLVTPSLASSKCSQSNTMCDTNMNIPICNKC